MIKLLQRVSSTHAITLDNGGEFAAHETVAAAMNANVFFAKPYASYQRGTKETPMELFVVLGLRKWR